MGLRTLRWGDNLQVSQLAEWHHRDPYDMEAIESESEKGNGLRESEVGVMCFEEEEGAMNQGKQEASESWKR